MAGGRSSTADLLSFSFSFPLPTIRLLEKRYIRTPNPPGMATLTVTSTKSEI
jgi:hypothetical protein